MISTARTEPVESVVRAPQHADVGEHYRAIVADLQDRGVAITRLGVLSRALDTGVPEHIAVQIAAMVDQVPR